MLRGWEPWVLGPRTPECSHLACEHPWKPKGRCRCPRGPHLVLPVILCHTLHLTEWRVSGRADTCPRLCSAEASEGLLQEAPRTPISLHSLPPRSWAEGSALPHLPPPDTREGLMADQVVSAHQRHPGTWGSFQWPPGLGGPQRPLHSPLGDLGGPHCPWPRPVDFLGGQLAWVGLGVTKWPPRTEGLLGGQGLPASAVRPSGVLGASGPALLQDGQCADLMALTCSGAPSQGHGGLELQKFSSGPCVSSTWCRAPGPPCCVWLCPAGQQPQHRPDPGRTRMGRCSWPSSGQEEGSALGRRPIHLPAPRLRDGDTRRGGPAVGRGAAGPCSLF